MTKLYELLQEWAGRVTEATRRPATAIESLIAGAEADTYRICGSELAAALAEQGWRSMDDCPNDDRPVWVWRAGAEPQCMKANGAFWRSLQERVPVKVKGGWTHWHPCLPPPPPGDGA